MILLAVDLFLVLINLQLESLRWFWLAGRFWLDDGHLPGFLLDDVPLPEFWLNDGPLPGFWLDDGPLPGFWLVGWCKIINTGKDGGHILVSLSLILVSTWQEASGNLWINYFLIDSCHYHGQFYNHYLLQNLLFLHSREISNKWEK